MLPYIYKKFWEELIAYFLMKQHGKQRKKNSVAFSPQANWAASVGLVVRVPGYRSRGSGSIPGATRFSEK
jgi:hypothetical protein